MSVEKRKPEENTGNSEELLKKIQQLEEMIIGIEQSRKKKGMVSMIGLILVILGILLFFVNLKSFAANKLSDDSFKEELATILRKDLQELAQNDPDILQLRKDMQKEVIPYVAKEIIKRFKKDMPHFQKKGEDFAAELKGYLEKDIKQRVVRALSESMVEVEKIMKEKYPNITVEQLHKLLKDAKLIFIHEISNAIEKKMAGIYDDIDLLKSSVYKFKECSEYKQLDPQNPETSHKVKVEMVEAMLELVVYHLDEQKGKLPAEPLTGGVK